MKNLYTFLLAAACSIAAHFTFAQSTGVVIRQATSTAGSNVLDPLLTGYTSATAAGFSSDDVGNSELPFKPIPAFSMEPYGTAANKDLRRGSDHRFSDFVPDANGRGVYMYYDNTNLLFRMRLGSIVPGSKGYSILIDTDEKFGSTGANADPNYQPATTGVNGNPGYEIEIVLETNFRIAIYNVDGTSNPTLVTAYNNWQDMSQVSIAGTNDNGDPDFFFDFYIPFSVLQASPFNLTPSSKLRMSATTVMAPKAAIGGPKSDIYGVDGNNSEEDYIEAQCSFDILSLQSAPICPMCTKAPVVSGPIAAGTVSINGTWTKSTLPGAYNKALIRIYKNGTLVATDDDSTISGGSWSVANVAVASGDVITAKAQGSGESMCLNSNSIKIPPSCTAANTPAKPTLTCTISQGFDKGFTGNNLSTGWTIYVENMTSGTIKNSVTNAADFTTSGTSPNITWNFGGGCQGGPNLTPGAYRVWYTNTTSGCQSEPFYFCIAGTGGSALLTSATPQITSTLTPGTSTVRGVGEANATAYLYVNGMLTGTTTVSAAGTFSFTGLALVNNDQVYVTNVLTGGTNKCAASSSVQTVSCYTRPPLISTDDNNDITVGQAITGTSIEPAGTVIRVFATINTSTPVATTTVQGNGTWSTGNAGTTPATYNALASTTYYATAQNGSCGLSTASGNVTARTKTSSAKCGSITGTVAPTATSISGILTGNSASVTVNLYLDGIKIGSASTSNNAWGPISVNTVDQNTKLYSNGILTIGIQETGMQEVLCSASATTIVCSPTPTAPIITSSTTSTVTQGSTVSYTISNAVSGYFYALSDASTGESLGSGIWAASNGNLTLTTKPLIQARTYNVLLKATGITGLNVCSSTPANATINVSSTLPVTILSFKGKKVNKDVVLDWSVENEINVNYYEIERSNNGSSFGKIATKNATGGLNRLDYSLMDFNVTAPVTYYRLKIVDKDGSFAYSRVVAISNNMSFSIIGVQPNPFEDRFSVIHYTSKPQTVKAELVDGTGRVVNVQTISSSQGLNTIRFDNLNKMASGVYVVRLITEDAVLQQKIIRAN
jgi:hypothetical protein